MIDVRRRQHNTPHAPAGLLGVKVAKLNRYHKRRRTDSSLVSTISRYAVEIVERSEIKSSNRRRRTKKKDCSIHQQWTVTEHCTVYELFL
jgi:hypothetical protein